MRQHTLALAVLLAGTIACHPVLADDCALALATTESDSLNDRLFDQGLCLAERRQFQEALARYAEVLKTQDTGRLRFEMGKAYLQLGDASAGVEHLKAAMAADPPEAIQELIAQELMGAGLNPGSVIPGLQQRAGGPTVGGYHGGVRLGRVYDTNVNSGPTSSSIILFGLPFTLSQAAKPVSAQGTRIQGQGSYRIQEDNGGFDIAGQVDHTMFESASDWSRTSINLGATRYWLHDNFLSGLGAVMSADYFTPGLARSSALVSATEKWQPAAGHGNLQLGLTLAGGKVCYAGMEGYSSKLVSASLEVGYLLDDTAESRTRIFGLATVAQESAARSLNSYKEIASTVGVEKAWALNLGLGQPSRVIATVSGAWAERRYASYNVMFDAVRRDKVLRVSGTLDVSLPVGGLLASFAEDSTDSTVSLNSARRKVFGLDWYYLF